MHILIGKPTSPFVSSPPRHHSQALRAPQPLSAAKLSAEFEKSARGPAFAGVSTPRPGPDISTPLAANQRKTETHTKNKNLALKRENLHKQEWKGEERERQTVFLSSSCPETRLGAGPILTASFRGLKAAEVFLPVIVCVSTVKTGPRGAGAPAGPGQSPLRVPPEGRAGRAGTQTRRGGAPPAARPPAQVTEQRGADPAPAARGPIRRVCCPGAPAPETPG